jgi:hypothetical protein
MHRLHEEPVLTKAVDAMAMGLESGTIRSAVEAAKLERHNFCDA